MEIKETSENDPSACLTELCRKLAFGEKKDIILRRNILKEIENIIKKETISFREEDQNAFENILKYIVSSMSDDNERCREISVNILNAIIHHSCLSENLFSLIIGTLAARLGKTDEREPSEEVRLLEVQLLHTLIQKYEGDILKYLNDLTNILSSCIVDDCPEIKRKSCECTSLLACKQKTHFHMVSSSLLKPLLQTISHQHFKTRTLCIYAVGSVISFGSAQDFEHAVTHLAQRLFDHSPIVRMATTEVIGDWLLTFKDRYSFFHYLIPLMLSAVHDDVPDIRLKASNLWKKCGKQYLSENENDYKDFIDFPRPEPENYPDPGNRPLVGCRILVQRNLPKILPALLNDLADWVAETRIKSSKVLYSLILHAEDKATMHLPSIIEGIISIAKDEVKEAAEQALRSAELLGFFIHANLLCDSIMVFIHKTPSSVHLSVFAAVLRGHKGKLPKDCFEGICKLLSDPLICRVRKAEEQANLLLCIEGLLASHSDINPITSYQIFTTLMSVSGLTASDVISKKAAELMEDLANLQECSYKSLYKMHSVSLLKIITANNELWTYQNPELFIFEALVQSGNLEEEAIELIIPVLTNNLHPSKDAKLRSKMLSLLIEMFKKFSTKDEKIFGKIVDLIREGVFPNLTWAPGKTASTLRTIAGASLYEILSKNCLTDAMLKPIADDLLSVLATLADDDEPSNRLLAGKIFENILPKLHTCVDENKIHATCHEFLPCMDDESDDIRMLTSIILKTYITSFPKDYNWKMYRAHLKHVYETAVIHMDDKNEKIRLRILNFLKEVAFAAPDLLLNELESKKYMMEAGDLCDNLIDHIRSLNVQDV